MAEPKELKNLRKQLEAQGWRIVEKKKGYMAYSPDGETIVSLHKTPSDHRWLRNTIRELKKGGFEPK